jgi:hypothetical protein
MSRRLTSGLIGLAAALWLVPPASAATATIGNAAPPSATPGFGCVQCHAMQFVTEASVPASYVVPAAPPGESWTITSWTARGGSGDGSASLEVWRPTGTDGEFRLIAIGPSQPFAMGALPTHSVSIPVLPGDHLGVLTGLNDFYRATYETPSVMDGTAIAVGNPAVGQTMGLTGSDSDFDGTIQTSERLNAEATLTSAGPVAATPTTPASPKKKKCKKQRKKQKQSAALAKKKKCKKRKKG